jgi:copper chaperone CopZ
LVTLRGGSSSSSSAEATNVTDSIPIQASEAYYLLWSPRFFQKLAIATTLLAVVRRIGWDQRVFGRIASSVGGLGWVPPGLVPNVVWPLLSSSCCAIQLLFNAVAVAVMGAGAGCLGFNTFLGPIRPYLLAVMVAYHTLPASPSATVLRYAFALMPEAVSGWNALLRTRYNNNSNNNRKRATSATDAAAEQLIQATLVVEVPTMGCVACVNKIESSLRNCAPGNVETASSWLNPKEDTTTSTDTGKKGGRAKIEVKVSSREELDDLAKSLIAAIEDAGFNGSTIEKLDIQTTYGTKN